MTVEDMSAKELGFALQITPGRERRAGRSRLKPSSRVGWQADLDAGQL